MKDLAIHYPGREMRVFWAVTESYGVLECQGFSCAPNNPEMWWLPEVAYSAHQNQLFATKPEAIAQAIKDASKKRDELIAIINKLHLEAQNP